MTILKSSKWRQRFKVHPAADVFPMMSDEELAELGKNIKARGLQQQIDVRRIGDNDIFEIRDGRNRLEAMERAGIDLKPCDFNETDLDDDDDAVGHILSANLHRRHLTKQERAAVIVATARITVEKKLGHHGQVFDAAVSMAVEKKPGHVVGEMPDIPPELDRRGGRGKKNPVKEEALQLNQALPKEQQASERTIKRALAESEAKERAPKETFRAPLKRKPKLEKHTDLDAARRYYLEQCERKPDVDLDAEQATIVAALREIARKQGQMVAAETSCTAGMEGTA